jgi:hypothetical protein
MKYVLTVALMLVFVGCRKEESVQPPSTTTAPETQPVAAAPAQQQPVAQPQATVTLAADSPIPASGVLLWLRADDAAASAPGGKLQTWQNPLVPNASATAAKPGQLPAVVAGAMNGHAVVRFDGTDQMLMTTIDIGPKRMPEGTVITVLRSVTADKTPFRKIYGNDNGGFDRAAGLDDRAEKNFGLFTGMGVAPYFDLQPNTTYVLVDEYSPTKFSGWVNGNVAASNLETNWYEDALPNLYLGGTGNVFAEYWNGDLAEILVYARKLSDAERVQVEDYLGQKYGVVMTRTATSSQ